MTRSRQRRRIEAAAGCLRAGLALLALLASASPALAEDDRAAQEAFATQLEEWTLQLHAAAPRPAPGESVRIQCVPSDEALAGLAGDFVVHGRLEVADFRASHASEAPLAVEIPGGEVGAQVGITIVCVGSPRVKPTSDGRYEAGMGGLRYVALLDRERSWWSPRSGAAHEDVLRHEQCHFDLAEAQARRLDAQAEEVMLHTTASGETPGAAAQAFFAGWRAHLEAVRREMEEIQTRYDRETLHGSDTARQAEWLVRCEAELAEARRGR